MATAARIPPGLLRQAVLLKAAPRLLPEFQRRQRRAFDVEGTRSGDVVGPWPIPAGLDQLVRRERERWRDLLADLRMEGAATAAVGASGWVAIGDGVAAAAAGTAKVVLNVIAAANRALKVDEAGFGFIGASGSAKPALCELGTLTQATAGSGSTSVTPAATDAGDATTVQATANKGYTTDPTAFTALRRLRVHPQAGLVIQFPLGREPRSDIGKAIGQRVTFESGETTTTIDAYMEFEE